jgi:hypothetical protein
MCELADAACMRAEVLSKKVGCVGAIAFSRTGNLATGVIRKLGQGGQVRYKRLLFRRCQPILASDLGPVR